MTCLQTRPWAAPKAGLEPSYVTCTTAAFTLVLLQSSAPTSISACSARLYPAVSQAAVIPRGCIYFPARYLTLPAQQTASSRWYSQERWSNPIHLAMKRCVLVWLRTTEASLTALYPIHPPHVFQQQGSHKKKPKHLLQWCWASPRWSQHGTLLMAHDTSHLET